MKHSKVYVKLAGIAFEFQLLFPETADHFKSFQGKMPISDSISIGLSKEQFEEVKPTYPHTMSDSLVEFSELTTLTADALIHLERCVFHGVAFVWRGKCYIFTAPSGTGKSTQYVLWKSVLGDQMRILNGDKPLLHISVTEPVFVHPSPWTGKEGMGRNETAPLGGIILLEQAQENEMFRLSPRQSAIPLFVQFLHSAVDEDSVRKVALMEERLLNSVPVWLLRNRGDLDSACMGIKTILQYEEQINEPI